MPAARRALRKRRIEWCWCRISCRPAFTCGGIWRRPGIGWRDDFGGVEKIRVHANDIWIPDVDVYFPYDGFIPDGIDIVCMFVERSYSSSTSVPFTASSAEMNSDFSSFDKATPHG